MLTVRLARAFSTFRSSLEQTLCLVPRTIAKQVFCLTPTKLPSRNCRAEGSL